MPKISELTELTELTDSDVLPVVDTETTTTKKITPAKLFANVSSKDSLILSVNTALGKNGIFRGKNLGTVSADNLESFLSAHTVSAGTFTDLYLGDYFTIQDGSTNSVWMVAGFDLYYNKGDSTTGAGSKHHVVLIPRNTISGYTSVKMNSTNTTGISQNADNPHGASQGNDLGAYAGSDMNQIVIPELVTKLQVALGTHLLSRKALLSKSMATGTSMAGAGFSGYSSGWAWYEVYATLPTEVEMYGSTVLSSSFYDVGEGCAKLPVFNFVNHVQYGRSIQWLRAVVSSTDFALANADGGAYSGGASYTYAIRPLICLG